ncbi:MAG: hypothetical protein KatS3mg042_1634 [Rhodothermaceae bacterium]|nr:MAG: hypothetical protein KatS3mg042_1634 [Rhodothermaceae bacterium]
MAVGDDAQPRKQDLHLLRQSFRACAQFDAVFSRVAVRIEKALQEADHHLGRAAEHGMGDDLVRCVGGPEAKRCTDTSHVFAESQGSGAIPVAADGRGTTEVCFADALKLGL